MYRKITIFAVICALGITLAALGIHQAVGANPPDDWTGNWVMGPSLTTSTLGCTAGDGLARFTGIYYPEQDRVYFLGGRCENNNTTGSVFYFDPVSRTYMVTGAVLTTPVSNYQVVRINDDLRGHGPGLYIVGGRNNLGGQVADVQVYYPTDNTTAVISTDPFPAPVLYSPGGVVTGSDGKIYVFGGFDGTNMYADTYIYDPLAGTGSRWAHSGCNLPTARSYIAAVSVGHLIYAIGGDTLPVLTPTTSTVVYDVNNAAGCWQDNLMADLPSADGDAPAVFVDENYIGGGTGGIFLIGGLWPAPGPQRLVFRYDIAADLWETFPALAIPAPASGRRNQAAVYIPSTSGGTGDGIPGLWTFGGYDGSGTNMMTDTSEFFANPASEILLSPAQLTVVGPPGSSVTDNFTLVNQQVIADTFNLSFTSDVTWTVTLPPSIGPIAAGMQDSFPMVVDIPASADCGTIGGFEVTATSQANPAVSASASISVRVSCFVAGKITDQTTGLGIPNAYVWVQTNASGVGGNYFDGYTDADGNYSLNDVLPGDYYFGADAKGYQPSFYPDGWPAGAFLFTLSTDPVTIHDSLVGSDIAWGPASLNVTLIKGTTATRQVGLNNTGTGPYQGNINLVDGSQPLPPQIGSLAVPGLPRVDGQIATDIAASPNGSTDFVVVLNGQADLSSANAITSWSERGWAVYNTLSQFAAQHQVGLRSYLDSQGVSYTPLYIINGVIVHSGTTALVNNLAARADVAQLVANHRIAVEEPSTVSEVSTVPQAPNAVEWNITQIGAPSVWSSYGDTGQGMVVAEIDTGTQWDHPALINHYRGWNGATANHNYNWYDPYFQCPSGGAVPCDPDAHGTHVMGTMVGDDGGTNQIGVAPGAKWIACKGGDAVSGYLLTNELLTCAQWILAPFDLSGQNPNPDMRPNVVNNSWGGGPNDYWYTGAVSAWRAAGIFPAFANGNAGPQCSTAHSPGDYWNSFATGASDNADMIGAFSSRGPALLTGFLKPQIMAPGVGIRSSVPGGGYQGGWSGTSMASPHTAGAVALLWSAAPELVGQIDLTGWVLEQTATPMTDPGSNCGGNYITGPNNDWGYGRLNIFSAVTMALNEQLIPTWVTADKLGVVLNPGATGNIQLSFTAPNTVGTFTATLILVGDDPYNPDIRIPITMNVITGNFFLPIVRK